MVQFLVFFCLPLFFASGAMAEGLSNLSTPKLFGTSGGSLVDKSMNPAISVNGLFMGAQGSSNHYLGDGRGIFIREIEAAFTAAVDPYFLGNVIINKESDKEFFGVEEAYFVTLGLPALTLKGGKFRSAFGKDNPLHTHALPLIDRPLATRTILSPDGLDSVGLEADLLVPAPWYFDIIVGGISAKLASPFATTNPDALVGTARIDNLFDLSDLTTLEIGGSYAGGNNQASQSSHYLGADVTLKYKSGRGKGDLAIAWVNEFISGWRNGLPALGATDDNWDKAWGLYSSLLVRLYQRFWAGGRFDYLKTMPASGSILRTGENLMLAYVPSEFAAIQLQGGLVQTTGRTGSDWLTLLQYNMTIGSHPAHAY